MGSRMIEGLVEFDEMDDLESEVDFVMQGDGQYAL